MVGQVAVTLTLLLIPVVWVGLLVSIVQIERIIKTLGFGPEGKRAFRNTESLKLWVAVFLGYVGYSTYIGGLNVEARRIINAVLVLALLSQVVYAILSLKRWDTAGVAHNRAERQASTARSTRLRPRTRRRFLPGTPLEPPRAGMTATTRGPGR